MPGVGPVPIFEISSRDLDADAPAVRSALAGMGAMVSRPDGFVLDGEAQMAMGWWFFRVSAEPEFVRALVDHCRAADPGMRGERGLLDMLERRLKESGCTARAKMCGDRSIMQRYWSWLMR